MYPRGNGTRTHTENTALMAGQNLSQETDLKDLYLEHIASRQTAYDVRQRQPARQSWFYLLPSDPISDRPTNRSVYSALGGNHLYFWLCTTCVFSVLFFWAVSWHGQSDDHLQVFAFMPVFHEAMWDHLINDYKLLLLDLCPLNFFIMLGILPFHFYPNNHFYSSNLRLCISASFVHSFLFHLLVFSSYVEQQPWHIFDKWTRL